MGDVGQRELSGPKLGHRSTILRALRRGPKLNRELRELTGISSMSLTGALATLRRLGAVEGESVSAEEQRALGPRAQRWRLTADGQRVVRTLQL